MPSGLDTLDVSSPQVTIAGNGFVAVQCPACRRPTVLTVRRPEPKPAKGTGESTDSEPVPAPEPTETVAAAPVRYRCPSCGTNQDATTDELTAGGVWGCTTCRLKALNERASVA